VKKVLILTSGKKKKLTSFKLSKRDLAIDLTTASFDDIYSDSETHELLIKKGLAVSNFDVIYFRLVGKSLEKALLVASFAKKNRIQIVDKVYKNSRISAITQNKIMEMKALENAGLPVKPNCKKMHQAFWFPICY